MTRDQRRFKEADRDGDGIATREEFTAFLHPEEFDYMRNMVVQVATITTPYTFYSLYSLPFWNSNNGTVAVILFKQNVANIINQTLFTKLA